MEQDGDNSIERKNNSRTVIIALILLIIFVLILILFLILIRQPTFFGSFARSETTGSTPAAKPSVITPQSVSFDNSYLFASPLKAAVNVEKIRITAYVLDGQGMGVAGKRVVLGNLDSALQITPISQVTDDSGRATFDISSSQSGVFTIEASVDSRTLIQKVTVTFD
jgi:hypothetical protein